MYPREKKSGEEGSSLNRERLVCNPEKGRRASERERERERESEGGGEFKEREEKESRVYPRTLSWRTTRVGSCAAFR